MFIAVVLAPSAPAYASFGDGTPTVPNPDVFTGSVQQHVTGSTGAFTYDVPLDIPPGRNGLQPDVTLQYNSQNTADGILGYGWSLSIPYIERENKTGSQNLYNTNGYFVSSLDGELAVASTTSITTASETGTTTPSILDSLPLTLATTTGDVTSDSRSYTVPSGGSNKVFVAIIAKGGYNTPTATLNGDSLTMSQITGSSDRAFYYMGTLANPTSGTFNVNFVDEVTTPHYIIFTLENVDQTNPVDVSGVTYNTSVSSHSTSVTTTFGDDLLVSFPHWNDTTFSSFGAGETEYLTAIDVGTHVAGSYKTGASSAGSETMTVNIASAHIIDEPVVAFRPSATSTINGTATTTVFYAPRVDESSNTYSFSDNTWTVYDKNGTRYIYGSSDSGRMYNTSVGTSTNTYRWYLQEIRDTNGNYVTYSYTRDSNQIYPDTITYTGNDSTDGPLTVSFATSTRNDIRTSYAPAFKVVTNKLISEIDAYVDGTLVRKYPLTYTAGSNGYRSLLASVQQEGYDDSESLTSLPAITFSYASSSTQFATHGDNTLPALSPWLQIADTNGNGINDVNEFRFSQVSNATSSLMFIDQTTEITNVVPPGYWAFVSGSHDTPVELGYRYVDLNADGKADVVRSWNSDSGGSSQVIYLNTYTSGSGYGWSATTTSGILPSFAYSTSGGSLVRTSGIFGDVNGDGLPDYEAYLEGIVLGGYLGNGRGFDSTSDFVPTQNFPSSAPTAAASMLVDINGDGLDDWVYSDGSNIYMLPNQGADWNSSPASEWTIATSTLYYDSGSGAYYDRGIRFADINGDGLSDFVRGYSVVSNGCGSLGPELGTYNVVLLNTGSGWATSTQYSTTITSLTRTSPNCSWDGYLNSDEISNWNGNGQMPQDVLTNITNSKEGRTSIGYSMSTALSGNSELPYEILVASAVGTYDGLGSAATTTYAFSEGKQYTALGVRERKFAGFGVATTTAPDSKTVTYFSQGTGLNTGRGEQSNGYAQINHPYRVDVLDASENLKQRTFYTWDTNTHASSTFIALGSKLVEDFASNGTHRDRAIDYSYASTTNDLVTAVEYGEVNGNSDGSFSDTGTDKRTTTYTYAASSTVNLSLPVKKHVVDYNSATSTDQVFYYDGLAYGAVSIGNNTKQEDWVSGSTYASSTKTYDSYGLVATSTDRNGNATSYVYDSNNLYVATSTNALSQQTEYLYNYANGKVKQSTDPNGRLGRNTYDGLGRLTKIEQSSTSTPSTYETLATLTYTDNSTPPSSVHRADYLNGASTVDTYDYYDGLSRLIQDRKSSQTAGTYAVSDRTYNEAGKLETQSLPYYSSGTSYTPVSSESTLFTTYIYDALQRPLTAANAVGTTTNTYTNWTTTVTDPNSNVKEYKKDAFDNLAYVVEHLSSSLATTTYEYNSRDNLATTTDADGNIRTFTYDGLNRRLTAQDLHASGDGTFGSWSYTYDDQGNITSQTDPKNQTVNRTYDALNRLLTEDYTGQSGTETTNTYDSCTNGIGYLCTASSTSAYVSNSYDILGRVISATTTISGVSYDDAYLYDRQGNITDATYPNGSHVVYTYNAAGQPSRAQRQATGDSLSDIVSSFIYAAHGLVQSVSFGNGASTTRAYDASALYRLSQLETASGGSDVQDLSYVYDAVGNITKITNAASSTASFAENYAYDALNRLAYAATSGTTTPSYIRTYTYDTLGNILTVGSGATSTAASTTPSILDSLPLTLSTTTGDVTSDSRSYTVPSGGGDKVFVAIIAKGGPSTPTATLNGDSLTVSQIPGTSDRAHYYIGTLANPTSGTFYVNFVDEVTTPYYAIFTIQDADQTSPLDVSAVTNDNPASSKSTSVTTTSGSDLLISFPNWNDSSLSSFGAGETEYLPEIAAGNHVAGSYKAGDTSAGTETMTVNIAGSYDVDEPVAAFRGNSILPQATTSTYTYAGTDYANPDAATQIENGVSTTTYAYDNNGNIIQAIVSSGGAATTTLYTWDWANRLTRTDIGANSATTTTTYGYDYTGQRVFTQAASSTTVFPSKYFSMTSMQVGSSTLATSTSYIFANDQLVSYIEQPLINGSATGTVATYYVHPDHLGSTNVVTNASGTVVSTKDYYPFGSTRVQSGSQSLGRGYIGEFQDSDSLSYLNSRYYSSDRGQFLSQDPVFWEVGITQDGRNALTNPQSLNSYSYANDNPITNKDPKGRCGEPITAAICAFAGALFIPSVAGDPVFNADGTISSSPEQANLEASLFIGGFAMPGGGAKNASGVVKYSPEVIARVERLLGPEYAKMLEEGGERAVLLGNSANSKVQNLVKSLYKTSDQIPGGTPGAAMYTKIAGQDVGGSSHFTKISESINRIGNIVSSIGNNISAGDRQVLNYVSGQLQKAQEMIKSIKN